MVRQSEEARGDGGVEREDDSLKPRAQTSGRDSEAPVARLCSELRFMSGYAKHISNAEVTRAHARRDTGLFNHPADNHVSESTTGKMKVV